jgi:peptidase M1-like protein
MRLRALFLLAFAVAAVPATARQVAPTEDAVSALVARLEQAAVIGDGSAIRALGTSDAPVPGLDEFADLAEPAPARFIIKERDRTPLLDGSERLLLEVFIQRGSEARIGTWRMDVTRGGAPGQTGWAIAGLERLSIISGLYRLGLNPAKQFDVRSLSVRGPDLTLDMPAGTAFVAETPDGPTAVVLLGRGRMHFTPGDLAEQTQLHIFAGNADLTADFDAAFLRLRPGEFDSRFGGGALVPRAVSRGDLRKAEGIFDEYVGKTLHLDLTDLSRDRWSLTPSAGDLIAEIRTRKFGSLTYARAGKDAEDISLFDRKRRRNISVYASAEKLASRGRSYSEDDLAEYDVLHYEIEGAFYPERLWIDGRARLLIRIRSVALTTLTLRLAEPLTVRSIVSPELGRLLHLRVVGQNSVIVNFPATITRNTELWLQVTYSGRLEPQALEREAIDVGLQNQEIVTEPLQIRLEPQYIYSNRSYWHPQNTVTDYATAQLRIIVPSEFDVVASGAPVGLPAPAPGPVESGQRARKMFLFDADRPIRYLACVISRFNAVTSARLNVPLAPARMADSGDGETMSLFVQANPRQTGRARGLADRSVAVLEYYASILGEAPYPTFTLAVAEADLPGGHSPPYFAVLNQTLPMSTLVWRNDPVSFDNYPTFFLAHELAHQWWGQAVGWKNYHEQWLSEGFAQYFAALYAAKERGDDLFFSLTRQMRRWAIERSAQGPVYLGYRLGHIKGEGRVFRAIIYNKAAMVLHMLRRLLGDDQFFAGVRRFYTDWRFQKAGTEDFRAAMEREAGGRDLTPFFDAWIYGAAIPELRFSYQAGPSSALLRFEHRRDVMPVPVTVTITYAGGNTEETVVPVLERVIERTIPLNGPIRGIEVNRDNAALAEFTR